MRQRFRIAGETIKLLILMESPKLARSIPEPRHCTQRFP
jgi:hypothetical protein